MEVFRLVFGLAMTIVCLTIAARRGLFLYRVGKAGQPLVPAYRAAGTDRAPGAGEMVKAELAEVAGQKKLLKWAGPGIAHFAVFWGFIVLVLTIIEGFGALFDPLFIIPVVGNYAWLGFLEDLFALFCVLAIVAFVLIRLREAPKDKGRGSRFFGSHLGPAWFVLFMIFNVVWTLLLYRGAQINALNVNTTDNLPFLRGAFISQGIATLLAPLGHTANEIIETVALLVALGVLLGFLVFVMYSKHLHIFTSIPNVAYARRPRALGALMPVTSDGKEVDFEDPGDDDRMGIAKVEDFSWKGLLDFAACTECGRCQSQCPAWNTGKPLSPKLLIMGLRDHALAKAPYLLASEEDRERALASDGGAPAPADAMAEGATSSSSTGRPIPAAAVAEARRPLVADPLEDETALDTLIPSADGHAPAAMADPDRGVVPFEVLWSCTTCGACVEQCPVDIEHIDHIVDMRRNQVLMEGAFPEEAGVMLGNLEHASDPWGRGTRERMEWTNGLDFDVRVFGEEGEEKIPDDVDYLFWVGCAGALDETAQRTSRAVATLLHEAGVSFMVLGEAEACTGDPARRLGHEFLFQMLARQNVETLNEAGAKRIVVTCAHCFNTIANEYPQVGGHYEVVHHTSLLSDLVRTKRLVPVARVDKSVTYHDPCYLGRHNRIFAPPREVIGAVPGARLTEMPRSGTRSFCCGAGGARMWMDENIGRRVNLERTDEALGLRPDLITAACPFCLTMLGDGVNQRQIEQSAPENVEVTDVAEVLLRSVRPDLAPDAPDDAAAGGPQTDRPTDTTGGATAVSPAP